MGVNSSPSGMFPLNTGLPHQTPDDLRAFKNQVDAAIPKYNAQMFGAIGDGVADDRAALNTLVNTTLTTGGDVYFPAGDYLINSALSFPSAVTLIFARGARLKPATGVTVTILGPVIAPAVPIFLNATAGLGTVSFSGNKVVGQVLPEWWGAKCDSGTTNSITMFAAAIAAAATNGSNLFLSATSGYYLVNPGDGGFIAFDLLSDLTMIGASITTKIKMGPENPTLPATPSSGAYSLFDCENGVNLTIQNVNIEGPENNGGRIFYAAYHEASTGSVTLDQVKSRKFGQVVKMDSAATLGGMTLTVQNGCDLDVVAAGVITLVTLDIHDLNTVQIRDSKLANSGGISYITYSSQDCNFLADNCDFGASTNFGVYWQGGTAAVPDYAIVHNCRFKSAVAYTAINSNPNKETLISDCVFNMAAGSYAVRLRFSAKITNSQLTNASIQRNDEDSGGTYLISGNTLAESFISISYSGARTVASEYKIVDNFITNPTQTYCVYFAMDKATSLLENNTFSGGTTAQVGQGTFDMTLRNNRFLNSGQPGWENVNATPNATYGEGNYFADSPNAFKFNVSQPIFSVKPRAVARPTALASTGNLTLDWNYDTYWVTGATTINNILLPTLGAGSDSYAGSPITLIPDTGATWDLSAAGNVLADAGARTVARGITLYGRTETKKWYEDGNIPLTLTPTSVVATAAITSTGTAGVGYATGAGGTVTQATDKATGVTLNKTTGTVTLNSAALAATTSVAFTLTSSAISATDTVIVNIKSGATANSYFVSVDSVSAGSCSISLRNYTAGSLSEAVVISFVVIKGVAS